MARSKPRRGSKSGQKAKAQRIERRYNALKTKKAKRGFSLARKAAAIYKKTKQTGKLSARDARTLGAFRKWKEKHSKQRRAKLSRAQKQGIKSAKRSYTTAERSRAARIGWIKRKQLYGPSGRADASSFQKAADTRRKNGGGKSTSKGKSSGRKGKSRAKNMNAKQHKGKSWFKSLLSTAKRYITGSKKK